MMTLTLPKPTVLSEDEIRLAELSSKTLQDIIRSHDAGKADESFQKATLRVSVERGDGEKADVALPEAAFPLLLSVLKELGHGKGVAVVATDTEVTTQQAADFLNVSRPYFVKLLEEGKIPYRTVGPRRRVLVADLLAYKAREEAERHRGLDELVAEAQKLGMY
jgi:excisionase family DNA binding protein